MNQHFKIVDSHKLHMMLLNQPEKLNNPGNGQRILPPEQSKWTAESCFCMSHGCLMTHVFEVSFHWLKQLFIVLLPMHPFYWRGFHLWYIIIFLEIYFWKYNVCAFGKSSLFNFYLHAFWLSLICFFLIQDGVSMFLFMLL